MLWQKDANNIYVNICQEEFEEGTFEKANILLGPPELPAKSNSHSLLCRNRGNKFFAKKQWIHAIKEYNTSLCYAQPGSPELSLAYANRSACFLHLYMYDKCLLDIELAKQGNFPARLKLKLEERKAVCLEEIEKNDRKPVSEPELSFEADDRHSCMANVLQIQHNEQFGRHITAKADIGVGKVLFKEESFVPSLLDKYKRCESCWKSNVTLIPCAKCTSVLFCEGPCAESPIHKIQCGMCTVGNEFINDNQMQLIRSVLIAINEFSNVEDLIKFVEAAIGSDPMEVPTSLTNSKSKYRAFLQLPFDRKTFAKDTFACQICFAYKTLMNRDEMKLKFSSTKHRQFLMHLIGQHLCTIQCNTGALTYRPVPAPLHVTQHLTENLSILVNYISHSCVPNVCLVSVDNLNLCITLRPIKSGDQLFVSYFRNDQMEHSTVNRRAYLRYICEFDCNCERCVPSTMPAAFLKEIKSDECYQYIRRNENKWNLRRLPDPPNTSMLLLCSCIEFKSTDHDSKTMMEKCVAFLNKYGHACWTWTPELDYVVKCYENVLRERLLIQ